VSGNRNRIKVLPESTVRRIAAGEVITRPRGAVKELVENSLDAGATEILVEVREGGKSLIRVTDNGCGMSRENARLAIARHATSKLEKVEDLRSVSSYGFRGEALAAIAAVSRMTLETCDKEGTPGTRLEVEAGDINEVSETAHPKGTTVRARTLFYNLGPRRSFLKSDTYELKLVVETVKGYAVAFPAVGFEMVSNDRRVFRLPPAKTGRERVEELYDRPVAQSMVELKVDNPMLSLSGFLSEPTQAKPYYDVQQVFFNRRPVRSRAVARAVLDAYGPVLGNNRPNFLVFIDTDPSRLDVNIHPTKEEVRFADERFLFDFVSEASRKALGTSRASATGADEFLFQQTAMDDDTGAQSFWQVHNQYILAQVTSGYVVVDQHAAHERVLFEEILAGRKTMAPQGLLFPISVELTAEQHGAYERCAEMLAKMGMETKTFSGRTVVVETVPAGSFIGKAEIREFFTELVEVSTNRAELQPELARLIACKGAVKAGQKLSPQEMESLFNRLFACREPYVCPHGRPAILKFTLEELDRKFGRT